MRMQADRNNAVPKPVSFASRLIMLREGISRGVVRD